MTQEEYQKFREKFQSIVCQKGLITSHREHISNLHKWNNDGSHDSAILKALDKRKELLDKFNEMLNGKTYDEWRDASQCFSSYISRIKAAEKRADLLKKQFENIKFDYGNNDT
jgi:DNA repair ATPase RecN